MADERVLGTPLPAAAVLAELWHGLSRDPEAYRRVARAQSTVKLLIRDQPGSEVVFLLDQESPEMISDPALVRSVDAEIELDLSSGILRSAIERRCTLAGAILDGNVRYRGPVSRFLSVVPILLAHGDKVPPVTGCWPGAMTSTIAHAGAGDLAVSLASSSDTIARPGAAIGDALSLDASEYIHEGQAPFDDSAGEFWALQCEGVHKSFDGNVVLDGLNFAIPEGAITVILGPSGTGKSVLLQHMVGLMFPDRGDVKVHGQSLLDATTSELLEIRKQFGILFQDGALFTSMNVFDNVAFPLRQHTNKPESAIREIVTARLNDVGLAEASHLMPGELSGGMRKRVGLARALALEPTMVVFDEPDSGLDPVRTALLCELIVKMHGEHGGAYVVVTHDIATAKQIGDYLAILWRGRIVQAGTRERILASRNPFVRQFLARERGGPLGMD